AAPQPGMGPAVLDDSPGLRIRPLRDFPTPKPEKVVVVLVKEIQITVEIEYRRWILPFGKPVAVVLEIVPIVAAGQIDRLAGAVREVARVGLQHPQRTDR